jgi:hypothetical protein
MLKEYESMNCNVKESVYNEAGMKAEDLKKELSLLSNYNSNIKKSYDNFLIYSVGKSKIESGTPEWKNFKATRNEVKMNAKSLQSKGEESVKKATVFHEFVEKKIVPVVIYCDVNHTLSQFQNALGQLDESQKKFQVDYSAFEKQVQMLIQQFQVTHSNQCKSISICLEKMKSSDLEISKVREELLSQMNSFKNSTSGKEKLYSCSSEFEPARKVEQDLSKTKAALSVIEKSFQDQSALLQAEVNQLK